MKRLSRRDLLGLGAAAGLVAASGASAAAPAEPGGSLRLGLAGRGIGPFDGRLPFDPVMRVLGQGAVFDCLTEIAADGSLKGELAESWKAGPGARSWTFRLREGVVFHDGAPFTAADVAATLHLHMAAGPSGAAWPVVSQIAQVRCLSNHEIQIVLRAPNTGLPFLMADPQLVILPALGTENAMHRGIGTGLYRVEAGQTPGRAVLHRVVRHYKDGRAGWFDRVEVLVLPDPEARLAAFTSGRVDAIGMVDPAWLPTLARRSRTEIVETRGSAHIELSVVGADPVVRRNLREALALSVDRERILARALRGHGEIAADDPLGPANAGRILRDGAALFDPGLAQQVVREAGLGGVRVAVAVDAGRVPGAAALSAEVEAALLRAGLVPDCAAKLRIVARLRPGRPTEDWAFGRFAVPETESDSGEILQRLSELRATVDATTRNELMRKLQNGVARHANVIIPTFSTGIVAYSALIARPAQVGVHWDMDAARIAERWWKA